ncbi:hypothetical protein T07_13730 [Trichinella nelsoni]|uniref:Uncharacterized protein n=1 Tax=Trichinella nelsoni TaxID=6336 RepID=A0A0V0SC50_9BILA|nr:hypothetical protein T07_13730 [Trichinella nelsoni]
MEVCSSLGSLKVQTNFKSFTLRKIIIDVMHGRYENISDEWWRIEADSVGTNGNNKATEEQYDCYNTSLAPFSFALSMKNYMFAKSASFETHSFMQIFKFLKIHFFMNFAQFLLVSK